ncbi:MAG: aminopeptidase P family protein [Andreesenia angusta]|nr:aminopeptidase P family protein [Andreesenia angusta]
MDKINRLRLEMKKEDIDIYIVPTSDPHQSEYVSDHWKGREYLSGFTGSAGTLLVEADKAILWTDGRYFIQAENELKNSEIKLYRMGEKKYPSLKRYIRDALKNQKKIGIYGKLISISEFEDWIKDIDSSYYNIDLDLIDRIWVDRPKKPRTELFIHEEIYSGESTRDKLKRLREYMVEKEEHIHIVSSLDEIAYLFNLRANDIVNNPVFISYAVINKKEAILFTDAKYDENILKYSEEEGFIIRDISEFDKYLENIRLKNIGLDPNKTNMWIKEKLKFNKILYKPEILTEFESIRNKVQIENMKKTHIFDGVAVIKTLNYIYKNIENNITEMDVSEKLREFRSKIEGFIEPSFDTIAAYGPNGAMMHYCADADSNSVLKRENLLLIDSGGQYLSGTTDITRTISLGKTSDEQIRDYTLVLKGMINLSRAKFMEKTSGSTLDILARNYLWNEGIDYKSGTGHGVGYLLSVHLGNQRISPNARNSRFKPGMVVTNEPGVYKEGKYGIRIENMLLVRESSMKSDDEFLEFETLTLCPFDKTLIDFNLLNNDEIDFIEKYHMRIRELMKDYLTDEEMALIW